MLLCEAHSEAARLLEQLPQQIHDALELVTVRVVDWPPAGEPSGAKAMFVGRQQEGDPDDEDDDDVVTPAAGQILLFAANLDSPIELDRALCHEMAHALGLSEWEVAELGLQ